MSAAHRGGYTHLVLSAAGFRAFTFLGALQALRDADMHRSVRHVAGCSGGAIAAFAFCLDLDPQHVAARCAASVADPARARQFLLRTSMIEGLRAAAAIP